MPALSILNCTVLPLLPRPTLTAIAQPNDRSTTLGSLALSAVTVLLAIATLVVAYLQLRLYVRLPLLSVGSDVFEEEITAQEAVVELGGKEMILPCPGCTL